jgi:hypothetical protein
MATNKIRPNDSDNCSADVGSYWGHRSRTELQSSGHLETDVAYSSKYIQARDKYAVVRFEEHIHGGEDLVVERPGEKEGGDLCRV